MFRFLERQSAFLRRLKTGGPRRAGPIRLTRGNVYILPTRPGLFFGFVLVVMLLGSLNYNNNLGFILTFLLFGMAVTSLIAAYRNLTGLSLVPNRADPVFAGGRAVFDIALDNAAGPERLALRLHSGAHSPSGDAHASLPMLSVPSGGRITAGFEVPAGRRGVMQPGPAVLSTVYPLGLFRAWTRVNLDLPCLVYPRPEDGDAPLPPPADGEGTGGESGGGSEDFSGLRKYRFGDSPRHVAWKAVAAGRGMLVKEFHGASPRMLWLDYAELDGLDVEVRLSRLCRWAVEAERQGLEWGLRLPGVSLEPGAGDAHLHEALRRLALFEPEGAARTAGEDRS